MALRKLPHPGEAATGPTFSRPEATVSKDALRRFSQPVNFLR